MGKAVPEGLRASYPGKPTDFPSRITSFRNSLGQNPLVQQQTEFVFDALFSLITECGRGEAILSVDCEKERQLIRSFFECASPRLGSYLLPLYYATRIMSRKNYGEVPILQPSLDIGSGDGVTPAFVFDGKRLTVGSDLFIHDLVEAQQYNAPFDRLMAFDVCAMPFVDNTFGTIFCMNTLYHCDDPVAAIRELVRILKPGGSLHVDVARSSFVSEWPLFNMLRGIGFDQAAREFELLVSKPENLRLAEQCPALIEQAGCSHIEVVPFMSLPLTRLILFFNSLEIFFWFGSSTNFIDKILSFMNTIVAPLLAQDRKLSLDGSSYYLIKATKAGSPVHSRDDEEITQRLACPACRAPLIYSQETVECRSCPRHYPCVSGIPLLTTDYLKPFELLKD